MMTVGKTVTIITMAIKGKRGTLDEEEEMEEEGD